jgi:Mg2+ and Co2+ transporter CorA
MEAKLTAAYEEASELEALFDLQEQLNPMARAARNLYQALQSARDAIKADAFVIEMRDMAYDVERNLDLLQQDVRNAIQYRMARQAENQAQLSRQALRASHRLNILAALFFPMMTVSSLLGMNLAHGLNPNSPIIFWTVFAAGLLLGLAIMAWVLHPGKSGGNRQGSKESVSGSPNEV